MSEATPIVICTRHPDYGNEYTTFGDVRIIDIDLGGGINVADNIPDDDDMETARSMVESYREQVKDAGEEVREYMERLLEGCFMDSWEGALWTKVKVRMEDAYEDGHESEHVFEADAPISAEDDDMERWWEDVVWPETGDGHNSDKDLGYCHIATIIEGPEALLGKSNEWAGS